MMTSGLDATLIGPLERVRPDSTDFLCLSGFNHSLALVSWLDESQVATHWQRLALPGSIVRRGRTNGSPASSRVYYFQLSDGASGETVLRQLEELQRERALRTVDISLGLPVARANPSKTPAAARPTQPPTQPPTKPLTSPPAPRPAEAANEQVGDALDEDEQWPALDQLVDDLDSFDI